MSSNLNLLGSLKPMVSQDPILSKSNNVNPMFVGNNLAPSLDLNKSASSYTYASKKAKKQLWISHFKQNKKVATELQLKGYDLRKEPRSFLLTIKGVSGIAVRDVVKGNDNNVAGSKFALEYFVTLFNKDISSHGSFYGRTYRSKEIPLKEGGGSWDASQEEFIYFHTSYTEKSSFAIIECVICRDFAG